MDTAASPAFLEPVIILSGMEEERAEFTLVKRQPETLPISVTQNGIKDHTLSNVALSRSWMIVDGKAREDF